MPINRPYLHKDEVANSLWRKYERTPEFASGEEQAISSVHTLVRAAESQGLERIIQKFVASLRQQTLLLRDIYENRSSTEWIDEWCEMHSLLFKSVFRNRGELRQSGHQVRFGFPGDEDLHRIPLGGGPTLTELHLLARQISEDLTYVSKEDVNSVCTFLARSHYGFIRVHPFGDGNGRIGRAITDQLALCLGYPPIIAGFPRLDEGKKERYHEAITACIGDPSCNILAEWTKAQIAAKLSELA